MKDMNERDDVNIYHDTESGGYVVELLTIDDWVRHAVCGEFEAAHACAAKALGVPWVEPMRFSQTYQVVTEESTRHGVADESGYDWQDSPETFKELVKRLQTDYAAADASENHGVPRYVTAQGEVDFRDGSAQSTSLHPANDRARRWWPKALRAAGLMSAR